MDEYLPFNVMMLAAAAQAALLLKLFYAYLRYTLVDIGKLSSPYTLTWGEIKRNSPFLIGTDVKARYKAVGSMTKIFSERQETKILSNLAVSFRRCLLFLVASVTVAFTGVAFANGDARLIILSGFISFGIAIWGLVEGNTWSH